MNKKIVIIYILLYIYIMIYWFTGQPGAGKTVLALKLIEHLKIISKKK